MVAEASSTSWFRRDKRLSISARIIISERNVHITILLHVSDVLTSSSAPTTLNGRKTDDGNPARGSSDFMLGIGRTAPVTIG
jgi:hypothetical protein